MRGTVAYFAKDGKIYAKTPEGTKEVSTALIARGRDLERFQKVYEVARQQRETTNRMTAPWTTPEECDHQGAGPCSHCCPCDECAAMRADPVYADVDEAGQLSLGVAGEQRAIPGLAKPQTLEDER